VATSHPISVVIPTYHRPDALINAISSVQLETSGLVYRIIVVDDAHDDITRCLVSRLIANDKRIHYLLTPKVGSGPAIARNVGVRASQSEFIAFLDDDDRWHPNALSIQINYLESADAVSGNAKLMSTQAAYHNSTCSGSRMLDAFEIRRHNPLITSTTIVRRQVLEDVGMFRTDAWLRGIEDYELWQRLVDRGFKVIVHDQIIADYCDKGHERLSDNFKNTDFSLLRLALNRTIKHPGLTNLRYLTHTAGRTVVNTCKARRRPSASD
jgi:glycosyltransferase involved in cell wall biosynthesis